MLSKNDNEDFSNFTKFCFYDNDYIDNYVKVKDLCNIIGKYRSSAQKDCNINDELNHKIPVVFHNLKITIRVL